jgi:delta24-sterol reductase
MAPKPKMENLGLLEYFVINYRWVLIILFMLPMTVCYDLYFYIRNKVVFLISMFDTRSHDAKVRAISQEIKDWVVEGEKTGNWTKLCTARPGWQAMSLRQGKYKKTYKNINVNLHTILGIDEKAMTVRVEPMCTMGQITHLLLPLGYTLAIVPELDDLTVGGLVAGCGIETSSHKFGLFQEICVSYELVQADGSVVVCSAENDPELFYSIPWSYGTLGFLVSVEIQIVKVKPYIDLTYIPYTNKADALKRFTDESIAKTFDFVETLAYSPSEYVVMLGNMSDTATAPMNSIGYWFKEWFFVYVKRMIKGGKEVRETIPIRDYYHRHTKSLFWEIQDIVPFGNNFIYRWLLGWTMPPKPALLKLTQTEGLRKLYEEFHIVQDMLVPIKDTAECLDVFDKEAFVYPIWLCPFKISSNATKGRHGRKHIGFLKPLEGEKETMFVDIGVYGNPTVDTFHAKNTCRALEDCVRRMKGYQMMYADSYMTKEEFKEMFDHETYNKLRAKLPHCTTAFPEVYDKICRAARL